MSTLRCDSLNFIRYFYLSISKILCLEENTVVSMMIRDEIDSFHERQSSNNDLSNSDVNDYNNLILQHVVLGSSLSWITLKELEIKHSTDLGFRDLRKKTMASLTAILSAEKGRYQKVVLTENHEVRYSHIYMVVCAMNTYHSLS